MGARERPSCLIAKINFSATRDWGRRQENEWARERLGQKRERASIPLSCACMLTRMHFLTYFRSLWIWIFNLSKNIQHRLHMREKLDR